MLITRRSPFSHQTVTVDLPVTEEQYAAWRNGQMIQTAMPNLSPAQREFLITGISPAEWEEHMKPI